MFLALTVLTILRGVPKCLNFFDSFDSLEGLCFGCLDSFNCFGSFERCYFGICAAWTVLSVLKILKGCVLDV